jgi:dihydrofolate reductase
MIISIISAIGKNNEIGKKNDLLWNLPADLKHFKETTSGHPVIMGQKTFESLKRDDSGKQVGRLLPNRRNIIISQDLNFQFTGAEIVHTIDELLNLLKNTTQKDEEVFVIGGGSIYKIMIEKADKLYITHVDEEFPDAEIFFPEIDKNIWQKTKSEKFLKNESNKYNLEFAEYIKKA